MPEYSCDPCSRFFVTLEKLNKHLETHVQCSEDGCTFTGSESSLASHFERIHSPSSVLYNIRLQTPEENAKWIAERKRRFPKTQSSVQSKKRRVTPDEESTSLQLLVQEHAGKSIHFPIRYPPFSSYLCLIT